MANLRRIFGTDSGAESAGVWFDYDLGDGSPPVRVKVARAGGSNEKMSRVADAKWKPYRRQLALDALDPKTEKRITAEIYAESVILDWENVEGDDGKPLPFTKENVVEALLALPDFFAEVVRQSSRIANFRALDREEDAKNS